MVAGRPKKDIDEKLVEDAIAIGKTVANVALLVSVAKRTLERNCAAAIERGRARRNSSLQEAQYKAAVDKGNVTMMIWLGKQWLNQKDKVDTTVRQGEPDAREMTDDELATIAGRGGNGTAGPPKGSNGNARLH